MESYKPCVHRMDRSLGDKMGFHISGLNSFLKLLERIASKDFSCPLIIVMHGGGCTPDSEIAVFNTHELVKLRIHHRVSQCV